MAALDRHTKRLIRLLSVRNIGWIVVAVAVIYLLFFDNDSVLFQFKLSREIRQLKEENRTLAEKIKQNKELLKNFDNPAYIEKFAREELLFRKRNEDIFIVKPDSKK